MNDSLIELGVTPEKTVAKEPLAHLAIFGQTQKAGKTTTLRTYAHNLAEVGVDVLIFRSGRGEIPFPGRSAKPMFQERLDWRSVEAMLWSFLNERPRVYRPILMRATRGAQTMEGVRDKIIAQGKKAGGWVGDRTYELERYFEDILPWLRGGQLGFALDVWGPVDIVDVSHFPPTVQQLVVASMLDAILERGRREKPLVVMLPEAQNFIHAKHPSPTSIAAARFTAEGAKLGLYLWIDSQYLTGVDQGIMRHMALVLQGVQTSDLEIRRICAALEGVKPKMVRELRLGDFLLHTSTGVRKLHIPLNSWVPPESSTTEAELKVDAKERKEYEDKLIELRAECERLEAGAISLTKSIEDLKSEVKEERARADANARLLAQVQIDRIRAAPRPGELRAALATPGGDRAASEAEELLRGPAGPAEHERIDLHVTREEGSVTVHVRERRVEATEKENVGRIGILVAEGLFDNPTDTTPVGIEYVRRGWMSYNPIKKGGGSGQAIRDAIQTLVEWHILHRPGGSDTVQVLPGAKARITVLKEA